MQAKIYMSKDNSERKDRYFLNVEYNLTPKKLETESPKERDAITRVRYEKMMDSQNPIDYFNTLLTVAGCESLTIKDSETFDIIIEYLKENPKLNETKEYRALEISRGGYIGESIPRWTVGSREEHTSMKPAFKNFEDFADDYKSLKAFEAKRATRNL